MMILTNQIDNWPANTISIFVILISLMRLHLNNKNEDKLRKINKKHMTKIKYLTT